MAQMTTNRRSTAEPKDSPSLYARMILGTAAIPLPRFSTTTSTPTSREPVTPIPGKEETRVTGFARPRPPTQQISRQTVLDRFTLCQLVAADSTVLILGGTAASLFFPLGQYRWLLCLSLRFWSNSSACGRESTNAPGIHRRLGSSQPWRGQLYSRLDSSS